MIRSILKLAAYSKAPRTTFALRHPRQTAKLAKFRWDIRHAPAPRVAALSAAVIALPLGLLIGRRRRGSSNGQ